MNSFSNPKQYYGLMGEMGVPEALVSSSELMLPPSSTTIKSVFTQSGNGAPGVPQIFQISTGPSTGYLKTGSLYLKAKIIVTQTHDATPATWAFNSAFSKGASAIINRLNVSCGGVMINSINQYNVLHDSLLQHASSTAYYENDSVLYEDVGVIHTNPANDVLNRTVTVCIPIISPWLNGNEQSVPLYLLNSPIVVEILYGSVATAFRSTVQTVTDFAVTEAQLVYEQLSVSPEFEASVKAKLNAGSVYTSYLDDYYNLQVASSQVLNYTVGLGLSSVKAVLWTEQLANRAVTDNKLYIPNGLTNFRLFLDGRQINLHTLDTQATVYAEMQRALQNLYDYTCTSRNGGLPGVALGNNDARGVYATQNFLGGINCNRLSDGAYAMSGTPCQNINFILEHTGAPDAGNFPANTGFQPANVFVMILYTQKLMIDANGAISLFR